MQTDKEIDFKYPPKASTPINLAKNCGRLLKMEPFVTYASLTASILFSMIADVGPICLEDLKKKEKLSIVEDIGSNQESLYTNRRRSSPGLNEASHTWSFSFT